MEKGIKETKELLKGVIVLTKVSAELLKDGVQVQDLIDGYTKLNGDPVKKAALEAALKDIHEVPEEIKDIDLSESVELVVELAKELPELLKAFKKA
jgi:ATP-dependent 26S proteasome regulatory subunit